MGRYRKSSPKLQFFALTTPFFSRGGLPRVHPVLWPLQIGVDSKESSSQAAYITSAVNRSPSHTPPLLPATHPSAVLHKDVVFLEEAKLCLPITSAPLGEHICFHFRALFNLLLVSVKRGFLENHSPKRAAYVFLITNNIFLFILRGIFSLSPVVLSLYDLLIK